MIRQLLGRLDNFRENCDFCGATITADLVIVADMGTTDNYGNRLFYIVGVPISGTEMGDDLVCGGCNRKVAIYRLYESMDITQELQKDKAQP